MTKFFVIRDKSSKEYWSQNCLWDLKIENAKRWLDKELAVGFAQASKAIAPTAGWRSNLEVIEIRTKLLEKNSWSI
jgi:hypothetical protein